MPVRLPPTGRNPSQVNTYPKVGTPPPVNFPHVGQERSRNMVGGKPGAKTDVQATIISSNLKAEVGKLSSPLQSGMNDFERRKRASTTSHSRRDGWSGTR
jgi:hypothetical protein